MADRWNPDNGWMQMPVPNPQPVHPAQPQSKESSKDFVQKLFTMLEDPAYKNIVQWSETGDSFIVLDASEFTKIVLPRHFKHSNFASFVRQLNKYDFHKVRSTSNQGYPENAWEFKHPDFQLHNKGQLDKIKRKTPGSSRRLPQASDPTAYSEQISKLESELDGLRTSNRFLLTRIDHLEEDFRMTLKNSNMLHEALMAQTALLHKTLGLLSQPHSSTVQFSSLQESMNSTQSRFLHPMNPSAPTNQAYANGNYHILLAEEDEVSVRICRKLLGQYGCEVDVANDGLEAVQRAEAGRYDLILINTILPSLDGLSCTELIRNFDSTTPIVAMMTPEDDSRSIDSRTVESYQKKGVTMILAKPFTKQDLYKTLGVFLKHPRSQISNHQNQPPPLEPQHPHQWMDAKKHPIRDDITDMSGMKKQRY